MGFIFFFFESGFVLGGGAWGAAGGGGGGAWGAAGGGGGGRLAPSSDMGIRHRRGLLPLKESGEGFVSCWVS